MADEIRPVNTNKINPVQPQTQGVKPIGPQGVSAFQEILKSKIQPVVQFSGHAMERLQKRNIVLTPEKIQKLNNAVAKAEAKGSRESLVLMDNLALIVSIKNHMVITAIDGENIKENVFTNIDSAIIV